MMGISQKRSKERHLLPLAMMSMLLALATFSGLASPTARADTTANSYVRIIHASPYIGIADVYVDGNSLLTTFPFAQVTNYVTVPAGAHKVQISLMGKGLNAAVLTQSLTVEPGKAYTVAAIGTQPDALGLQVFVDDNRVVKDKGKIRIYHLAPDAGSLNVTVGEEGTVNGITYEQGSDYISADSGPCKIDVQTSTQSSPLSVTARVDANKITSIFAIGMINGTPKITLVTSEENGFPGLPQTGGMPVIPDLVQPSSMPWLCMIVVVAMIAIGIFKIRKQIA